jgi:hypothetical protein
MGISQGPIWGTIPECAWRECGKPPKPQPAFYEALFWGEYGPLSSISCKKYNYNSTLIFMTTKNPYFIV